MALVTQAKIELAFQEDQRLPGSTDEAAQAPAASLTACFSNRVHLTLEGVGSSLTLRTGPQMTVDAVTQDGSSLTWTQDQGVLTIGGFTKPKSTSEITIAYTLRTSPTHSDGMILVGDGAHQVYWSKVDPTGSTNLIPQADEQGCRPIAISIDFTVPKEWRTATVQAKSFPLKPQHLGIAITKGYKCLEAPDGSICVLYPPELADVAGKFLSIGAEAMAAVRKMVALEEDSTPKEMHTIVLIPDFVHTAFEYISLFLINPTRNPTVTPSQVLDTLENIVHECFHLFAGGMMPEQSLRDFAMTEGLTSLHQFLGLGEMLNDRYLRLIRTLTARYILLDENNPPICNDLPHEKKPVHLHYQHAAGVWGALEGLHGSEKWREAMAVLIRKHAHKPTKTEDVYECLIDQLPVEDTVQQKLKEGFRAWFCETGIPRCTVQAPSIQDGIVTMKVKQNPKALRVIPLGTKAWSKEGKALSTTPIELNGAVLINGQIVVTEEEASWKFLVQEGETLGAYSLGRQCILPIEWDIQQSSEALGILAEHEDDPLTVMRAIQELVNRSRTCKDSDDVDEIIATAMERVFKNASKAPLLLHLLLMEVLKGSNDLVEKTAKRIAENLKKRFERPLQDFWSNKKMDIQAIHESILRESGYTYILWVDPAYVAKLTTDLNEKGKSIEERTLAFIGLSKSKNPNDAKKAIDALWSYADTLPAGPTRDITWNRIVTGIANARMPWDELLPYFERAKNSPLWNPKNVQAYLQLYASFLVNNLNRENTAAIAYIRGVIHELEGDADTDALTKEHLGYVNAYLPRQSNA